MRIVYVAPTGEAVPCNVGKKNIIPQVKGGYRFLRLLGFPTTYRKHRRSKK